MTDLQNAEYAELRRTVRERGTARVWVFVAGIFGWAAVVTATGALSSQPLAVLVPLFALGATFEAVNGLHVGVERIGRYLQLFYEDREPGWETVITQMGRFHARGGTDPLFVSLFGVAIVLNALPALVLEPVREELAVVAAAHLLVISRVLYARYRSKGQRAADLERFQTIKDSRAGQ